MRPANHAKGREGNKGLTADYADDAEGAEGDVAGHAASPARSEWWVGGIVEISGLDTGAPAAGSPKSEVRSLKTEYRRLKMEL